MIDSPVLERFSRAVLSGLAAGKAVEIDGLGTFYPHPVAGFRFAPHTRPAIFIAYGAEDSEAAAALYLAFERAGFSPWMDSKKLLPGQNWARALEAAIETSDFCVPCFSSRSVARRGGVFMEQCGGPAVRQRWTRTNRFIPGGGEHRSGVRLCHDD